MKIDKMDHLITKNSQNWWSQEVNVILHDFTAVKTTNMCPQRLFSSVQTCGLVDINQVLPWFSRTGQDKILSPFLEHSEEHVGI